MSQAPRPAAVDLYGSTYSNFDAEVLAAVRRAAYGQDIGQNSWITAAEYDTFYGWLGLAPGAALLEVASGSGGPALHLARTHGCRITGVDLHEAGLETARAAARAAGCTTAEFRRADLDQRLPFADASFAGLVCMDSLNHFRDRRLVFGEWRRVLRPGGRAVFTDPVVLTGPVTAEELARRSSIGVFLFVPREVTERLLVEAGFRLLRAEDATGNLELTSGRWHAAREERRADLVRIEGEERFAGLQRFLETVHVLARERRLSRWVFLAER